MRIGFRGELTEGSEIKAGLIGCGSHAFRNIVPAFQFAPVRLIATCDLDIEKARAFAGKFGADGAYADYREMLEKERLDAVFVVAGYDAAGRPLYPKIAAEVLEAGRHVWIEKPPAASCGEIEMLEEKAARAGRNAMVGMKKMFFPANEKAKELCEAREFGGVSLLLLQYPQYVPTVDELRRYREGENVGRAVGFLDHLCHPVSLMLYIAGMPETLSYARAESGAGVATFGFAGGAVASIALTYGASVNGGMERTTITGRAGAHVTVENNVKVSLHRAGSLPYGASPDFFAFGTDETTAVWEPEFSLGQLYNKGLFLLGYYNEVNEFAASIIEERPVAKGTLEQAWQATRIFEAFGEGPGKLIAL